MYVQQQPVYGGYQQPVYSGYQPVYGGYQQPMVRPVAMASVAPVVAMVPPVPAVPAKPWSSTLCSCTEDTSACLDGLFCYYCQIGYQTGKFRVPLGMPHVNMDIGSCFLAALGDFFCLGLVGGCMVSDVRHRTAARYNIIHSGCLFFEGYFCPCCSLCQTHREMTVRGDWPGGVCVQTPSMAGGAGAAYGEHAEPAAVQGHPM